MWSTGGSGGSLQLPADPILEMTNAWTQLCHCFRDYNILWLYIPKLKRKRMKKVCVQLLVLLLVVLTFPFGFRLGTHSCVQSSTLRTLLQDTSFGTRFFQVHNVRSLAIAFSHKGSTCGHYTDNIHRRDNLHLATYSRTRVLEHGRKTQSQWHSWMCWKHQLKHCGKQSMAHWCKWMQMAYRVISLSDIDRHCASLQDPLPGHAVQYMDNWCKPSTLRTWPPRFAKWIMREREVEYVESKNSTVSSR
jgi:hypothetical protein